MHLKKTFQDTNQKDSHLLKDMLYYIVDRTNICSCVAPAVSENRLGR